MLGSIGPPFLFLFTSKLRGRRCEVNQSLRNKFIHKTSCLATIEAKSRNFSLHAGVTVILALAYNVSRGLTGRSVKSDLVLQNKKAKHGKTQQTLWLWQPWKTPRLAVLQPALPRGRTQSDQANSRSRNKQTETDHLGSPTPSKMI